MRLKDYRNAPDWLIKSKEEDGYTYPLSITVFWYNRYEDIKEKHNKLCDNIAMWKKIIFKGLILGYYIKCPSCGVEYYVSVAEFCYGKNIICMDCGSKYSQHDNIKSADIAEEDASK